jgi:hypothetical protein
MDHKAPQADKVSILVVLSLPFLGFSCIIYVMKMLEKNFKRSGFNHELIKREGDVAIYKRGLLAGNDSHYEVIKITSHNGYSMGGQYIEPAETYPGASLWGLQGWTHQTLELAEENYEKVCKRFNHKGALSSVG